ncbi:hypothetical protein MOQ_001173 [Trypanosoma cruzi marinkellei]|uniref:Uncharacterized protein n=1 Tax=Trypanosoma cruzi marinkellei TaxID=85056 RepID=K2NUH5_TRYCR|nr:hypothetical protein MOQ_001173 [Trypanosoma cruzi marinkellei]
MLVECGAGNPMGFRLMPSDEMRNFIPSPMTAAFGDLCGNGYTLFHKCTGTESGSSNEASTATTFLSQSPRRTDGVLTSSHNSSVEMSSIRGVSFAIPSNETWSVGQTQQTQQPQPQQLSSSSSSALCDRYVMSFDEAARYNYNTVNGNETNGNVFLMSDPLSSWKSSLGPFSADTGTGGSGSRNGPFSINNNNNNNNNNGTTEFNRVNTVAPYVGCNDIPTSPGVSHTGINISIGGAAAAAAAAAGSRNMLGQKNSLKVRQPSWTSPEQLRVMMSSPLCFSNFDGEKRLKEKTLRFKMLPSPVPYELFFAETLSNPSIERMNQYKTTMVRWYKRILPAQENTRARVRQRCPSPPKSLIQETAILDAAELQLWSEQCCRWWDETSRKRTRRGHRGGKAMGNGQISAAKQQRENENIHLAGDEDKRHFTAGHSNFLPSAADASMRAQIDDENDQAWMNWVKDNLEETFLREE